MADDLASRRCEPCERGTPPLPAARAAELAAQVPEWQIVEDGRALARIFRFEDFVSAVQFVNRLTPIAEGEGHHPDLEVGWGRVRVRVSTHAAGGLTDNDFILAAKIDRELA
ncbi:MAG: 4a-hydroxytetrahydrobiopterin dehydratase [Candidatus Dormibacterales bacterium]